MRYDIAFDALRFDADPAAKAASIRPEFLAYARFETTLSFTNQGLLDLVFDGPAGIAIVPWILIEGVMLLEREESSLIWPSSMRWLDPDLVDGIERLVEPWLRSRVAARFENESGERFFQASAQTRELIAFARESQWFGATPTPNILRSIAPHRYAWRFAENAAALVCGIGAANGGALLARRVASVRAVLPNAHAAEMAARWFGADLFSHDVPVRAWDLYVGPRQNAPGAAACIFLDGDAPNGELRVPFVEPIPPVLTLSYDLDDAPETLAFSVRVPSGAAGRTSTITEPPANRGSAGRIGLLVREDCLRAVDADTDAVTMLARLLQREGFETEIVTPSHFDPERHDLIHVFGFRYARGIRDGLERAAALGTPIVVTPYADDPTNEHHVQAQNVVTIASSSDEALRAEYLDAMRNRKLRSDDAAEADEFEDRRRLFELARVAFATGEREEQHLRSTFGFTGTAIRVPAFASPLHSAADVSRFVGSGDFMLLRGPVHPWSNGYMIARAAAQARLPLVVTGPVTDALCYQQVMQALGELGIWLPAHQLDAALEAGLVSRARVAIDVSWTARGLHHLATAGAARCALVVSSAGYAPDVWGDAVAIADPASLDSIEHALRFAWDRAPELGHRISAKIAATCDPFAMLVATATGYQSASAVPAVP